MGRRRSRSRASRGRTWLIGAALLGLLVAVGGLSALALRPAAEPTGIAEYTPAPVPTQAERPVVLFIGDSYSAGAGSTAPAKRWTTIVSRELGWRENNHALGGTGYLATSGVQGCGLDHCGTYGEVITSLTDLKPNIVVISGGRNDGALLLSSPDAVSNTVRAAIEKWPDAAVVVTTPIWDDGTPSTAPEIIDSVRAAATGVGAKVVELGQPLEGHPEWIVDDGVHPNDAGHAAIANSFISAWG